jgi:hypothetical protein
MDGLYKKNLSETLNSEIKRRYPYNKSLLSYKRWSDTLRPPFCGLAHRSLQKFMEMWYEKPIYLHNLPIEEQVENVRRAYGYGKPKYSSTQDRATDYIWTGDGDWHY